MSCGYLATYLDHQMLHRRGTVIAASSTPDTMLPFKTGAAVADELGGRLLIRYLRRSEVSQYLYGNTARHFVTPTPYSSADCTGFLALPEPTVRRGHVLLLDPAKINEILGPRWVEAGQGIEYLLPHGFTQEALARSWALELK
jgi:hypothetical protein